MLNQMDLELRIMNFLVLKYIPPLILTIINTLHLCGYFQCASFVPQMKTALQKFLFPICILLLGGFINLYADTDAEPDSPNTCVIDRFVSMEHPSLATQLFGKDKKLYAETEVEEQEEREEEALSQDLHLQFGGYLTAFFYGLPSGIHHLETTSAYAGYVPQFEGSPLRRHVRFQVFLI